MRKNLFITIVLLIIAVPTIGQWALQTSGKTVALYSVHFIDANTGYIAGDDDGMGSGGAILKTVNGGTTWTSLASNTYTTFNSVRCTDANTVYIVGGSGTIMKTANGGTTWTFLVSNVSANLKSICFPNTTTAFVVGSGGTIIKTVNSGTNWTTLSSGKTTLLKSVYFINTTTGYAVGDSGTIIKTVNGGTSWTSQSSGLSGPYNNINSVYFTDVNTGYAVSQYGKIIKTTNGGTTWTALNSGITGNDFFSVYFTDANTGYVVGYTKILKTINAGTSWTAQSSGISGSYDNLNSIFFINATTGFTVGNSGRILKTTNGGGVGISENKAASGLNIFPNPANDIVNISIDEVIHNDVFLKIYNVTGAVVKTLVLSQNQQNINIRDLNNGIYFVEIKSDEGTRKQKLIIQR